MRIVVKARRDPDTKSGNPYHDDSGKFASPDTIVAPKWYLKSRKLIEGWSGSTMTAGQLASMLKQVSQDELKWTGLDKFVAGLNNNPDLKVKKEDVLAQIIEPTIQEKVLANKKGVPVPKIKIQGYDAVKSTLTNYFNAMKTADWEGRRQLRDKLEELPKFSLVAPDGTSYELGVSSSWNGKVRVELYRLGANRGWAGSVRTKGMASITRLIRDAVLQGNIPEKPAKETLYGKYSFPGGTEYTEMIFTLPTEDMSRVLGEGEDFRNGHWGNVGAKNVIAHVRYKTRMIDGLKTLFIEEVQSDTHEAGRERGYKEPLEVKEAAQKQRDELVDKFNSKDSGFISEVSAALPTLEFSKKMYTNELNVYKDDNYIGTISKEGFVIGIVTDDGTLSAEEKSGLAAWGNKFIAYRNELKRLDKIIGSDTPKLPFASTWDKFVMRRMIREAAEKGFKQIAWTSGVIQAQRYNLGQHLRSISLTPEGSTVKLVARKWSGNDIVENVSEDRIVDYIGKDLASKYKGQPLTFESHELDNTGTPGMNVFYDRILPSTMKEIISPFGGKVDSTEIKRKVRRRDTAFQIHKVVLTPELTKAALGKGFPLFKSMAVMKSLN